MAPDRAAKRYRMLYAKLLRLYPASFHRRFGEGMAQTFNDLCRERREAGQGLFVFVLGTFAETFAGIFRERLARTMGKVNVLRPGLATVTLLLVPLLAMRFSDQVNWGRADFAVAGVLLFGAGLAYEIIASRAQDWTYRAAIGLAVAAGLILVWTNLAVGLIGSGDNPANLMYFGVLLVGIIGAFVARLRPHGMARALSATALAQVLVALIALVVGAGSPLNGPLEVVLINGFFVALFAGSAWLFHRAALGRPEQTRV